MNFQKVARIFCLLLLTTLSNAAAASAAIVATNITLGSAADHSLFLKSDGSLWGMGYSGYIGVGGDFRPCNMPQEILPGGVTAMALGNEYSLFLKSDGSVWGVGQNDLGGLGLSNYMWAIEPVRTGFSRTYRVRVTGTQPCLEKTLIFVCLKRRVETALQRMELSFIMPLPTKYHSLIAENQPKIRDIVVTENKPGNSQSQVALN